MFTNGVILEEIAIIKGALYAIHWPEEEDHSLDQMAESYNDVEYLSAYFNKNAEKLKYFKRPSYTPEDAVIRTQKEVNALIQKLARLAKGDQQAGNLDDLFKPLHATEAYNHSRYYTDVKAKGHRYRAPWIRVYAVKCDENLYVVTGYGIKLVQDMRDDPDLVNELTKLELATEYLKSTGMID